MRRECRERFPRHRLQRKPLISDPGMHHGTCVTHVPWCMPGPIIHGGGENVLGIPGTCTTRNFTYLARGLWLTLVQVMACSLAAPSFYLNHWCHLAMWATRGIFLVKFIYKQIGYHSKQCICICHLQNHSKNSQNLIDDILNYIFLIKNACILIAASINV